MQQTVDSERQMVTDASHEIRAPLTVMMGKLRWLCARNAQ